MIHLPLEPLTFRQAAAKPEWCAAMSSEYRALMNNQTWTFYPQPSNHNVMRNKCISKVEEKPGESVDRYKAQLVAKAFDQKVEVIAMRPLVELPNQHQSPYIVRSRFCS